VRTRRIVVALLVVLPFVAVLPFGITVVIYQSALRDLGDLPRPTPGSKLPRILELGLWDDVGERVACFEVDARWPWTPVTELLELSLNHDTSARRRWKPRRPGTRAADRVASLWLASKPEVRKGKHLQRTVVTVWLSRHWTAAELTQEMALRSYFGRGAVGIDQAARAFFGKTPQALEPAEAALLIGLLQSPGRLSPDRHPERALARRNLVLDRWDTKGILHKGDTPRRCRRR